MKKPIAAEFIKEGALVYRDNQGRIRNSCSSPVAPSQCPMPIRVLAAIFGPLIAAGTLYLATQAAFPIQDEPIGVSVCLGFLGLAIAFFGCVISWAFIEFSIKGE